MNDINELRRLQSLPLEDKITLTKLRIQEWYEHWGGAVFVSFSGGKDSTVVLKLVRELYPDVRAVYCDTGLEYPEVKEHVKKFNNVEIIRPKKTFKEVVEKFANTPDHCFIWNDEVNGVGVVKNLDKRWYSDLAEKRIADFGINLNTNGLF